ncbi:MAG: fibronectin type III domain-containing protein [Pirellulales bacterium]
MSNWVERAKRLVKSGKFIGGGRRSMGLARRMFTFEPLEQRLALAAAGLVPVGSQPAGALTGKIVYMSPGHGYQYDSSDQWYYGRSETQEMIEPLGTQDQGTYLADYLFRAGATVVPMRPIGHQLNEYVLDNDSVGVMFTGSWSNSTGTRYYDEDYGATADAVSYKFASVNATETATATYTPNFASGGFYPVYAWAAYGSNRTNQLYEINHSGGTMEVRIDHRMVGNGWVYLGTYHFDAGSNPASGSVVISNQSTAGGSVVIADAIRFGNGMGDVPDGPNGAGNSGGTISGKPREDEAALLWIIRSIGMGVNTSTFFSVTGTDPNVSGPARLAEEMNANTNAFGSSVYLAIHSNAASGTARGAIGLITNSGSPTPNQTNLATWIGQQINEDLRAVDQDLGFTWSTRTTYTLTGAYGEFNADDFTNSNGVVEMDATLAEVAFHDNVDDALIMRNPKGRDAIGRAMYQALVQYFDVYGGLNAPLTAPSAPTNVSAVSNGSGQVTISWVAGPTSTAYGAAATDYRIYASTDGYGFDGGRLASTIAGGTATSKTITGLDPNVAYFFKVVAVNSGGESPASEVLTALPQGGAKQVLIVNGFDRNDASQDFRYTTQLTIPGSNVVVDRVFPRYNNSFDYVVQVQRAIQAEAPGVHVASTSNEAVINGTINLNEFDTVVWISGTESTTDHTFDATEQTKVTSFIAAGGNLFVTGSELGWDLDQQNSGRTFYESTLKADYVNDDAGTYTVAAVGGGIFAGLSNFGFSSGATFSNLDGQYYDVAYPDVIAPQAGATSALTYSGGTGGTAAIQYAGTGGQGSIVMFGFPFDTITSAATRQTVMGRVLDFFGVAAPTPNADFNSDGAVDLSDYIIWRKNNGLASGATPAQGDANNDGAVNANDYAVWRSQFGTLTASGANAAAASAALPTPGETAQLSEAVSPMAWANEDVRVNSQGVVVGRVRFRSAAPTVNNRRESHQASSALMRIDSHDLNLLALSKVEASRYDSRAKSADTSHTAGLNDDCFATFGENELAQAVAGRLQNRLNRLGS